MSFDPYEFDRDYGQSSRMESIGQYTAKTFLWMVLGLLVTFGIALLGWVTNATLYALAYVPYIHLIVLIATIVLSITMVSRFEKMSEGFLSPFLRCSASPCPCTCISLSLGA